MTCYITPFISAMQLPNMPSLKSKGMILAGILVALVTLIFISTNTLDLMGGVQVASATQGTGAKLIFSNMQARSSEASDIFVINGTDGNDGGVRELIDLMQSHGLSFYAENSSSGIIGKNDVAIIKVNSQWDERGGTNTDLVKALIQAIIDHPQGFSGEVIIADKDSSQSMQKVADSFPDYKVSTYLWDTITNKRVNEYADGDLQDGYVVESSRNPETGLVTTYPKFKTEYGTNLSFKLGVWDSANKAYDSSRLKVINVPVLKSHAIYGVTASIKHYMGVASDKLSREIGGRAHSSVGSGGMGTEMVQTRFPALNIVDAIWVNANPGYGPSTSYGEATKIGVIIASTDPIALDYWAAKEILMPAARAKGYDDLSSIDPDNISPGSFGNWLRRSMEEIRKAGYRATIDEDSMNIYVAP
jgi:uncharacterized protein (DUF362 family)